MRLLFLGPFIVLVLVEDIFMIHYHKCYKNNNNDEDIIGQPSIIVAIY